MMRPGIRVNRPATISAPKNSEAMAMACCLTRPRRACSTATGSAAKVASEIAWTKLKLPGRSSLISNELRAIRAIKVIHT